MCVGRISFNFCSGAFCAVDVAGTSGLTKGGVGGLDAEVEVDGDAGVGAGEGATIGIIVLVVVEVDSGAESSEVTVSESLGAALGEVIERRPEMLGDRRRGTSGSSSSDEGSLVRTRKKNRIGASCVRE